MTHLVSDDVSQRKLLQASADEEEEREGDDEFVIRKLSATRCLDGTSDVRLKCSKSCGAASSRTADGRQRTWEHDRLRRTTRCERRQHERGCGREDDSEDEAQHFITPVAAGVGSSSLCLFPHEVRLASCSGGSVMYQVTLRKVGISY